MTRITSFGRKRTYLQAGFGLTDTDAQIEQSNLVDNKPLESIPDDTRSAVTAKPRKRRRKSKTQAAGSSPANETEDGAEQTKKDDQPKAQSRAGNIAHKEAKPGVKRPREGENQDRAAASERRRLKRIAERQAHITCLGCRKTGHLVKDCSDTLTALHDDDGDETGNTAGIKPAKSSVGLCYRCGSTRHRLSRCKKAADPTRPLPFASCFVCSQKGHLASSCPRNQEKGIYPNGGSCKICGQTSHLAKDCTLRAAEAVSQNNLMLGDVRTEGGADEDDFHVIKRRRDAVLKEETILQKLGDKTEHLISKPKPKVVVFR